MKYTIKEALQYSKNGQIEEWVHSFLNTVGKNKPFSEGLKMQKRFWLGPVMYDLSKVTRCVGADNTFKYFEPAENFENRVKGLQQARSKGFQFPPLIVENVNGELILSDGNHRIEALKREGVKEYWVIFWGSEGKENLSKLKKKE